MWMQFHNVIWFTSQKQYKKLMQFLTMNKTPLNEDRHHWMKTDTIEWRQTSRTPFPVETSTPIAATNPSMAARPIQMSKLLDAPPCSHRMPTLWTLWPCLRDVNALLNAANITEIEIWDLPVLICKSLR
jgi:hypothetical protein